jgi:hypothetical protein
MAASPFSQQTWRPRLTLVHSWHTMVNKAHHRRQHTLHHSSNHQDHSTKRHEKNSLASARQSHSKGHADNIGATTHQEPSSGATWVRTRDAEMAVDIGLKLSRLHLRSSLGGHWARLDGVSVHFTFVYIIGPLTNLFYCLPLFLPVLYTKILENFRCIAIRDCQSLLA